MYVCRKREEEIGMDWLVQKVQTICIQMEDRLHQEAKHVESQVQMVGLNMNNFFAEVMQDFLPTSHNTATPEKSMTSDKEEPGELTYLDQSSSNKTEDFLPTRCDYPVKELESKEPTDKPKCVTTLKDEPCLSTKSQHLIKEEVSIEGGESVNIEPISQLKSLVKELASKEPTDEQKSVSSLKGDEPCMSTKSQYLIKEEVSIEGGESVKVEPISPLTCPGKEPLTCPGKEVASKESTDEHRSEPCSSSEVVPLTKSQDLIKEEVDSEGLVGSDIVSSNDMMKAPSVLKCEDIPDEKLEPPTIILQTGTNGEKVEEKESSDFDNVMLGESCMVVDSKDASIHIHSSTNTRSSKSFKKKLKNALISRLRSTTQREYEQLAILYGDDAYIPAKELDLMKSAHELAESDWEIV